MCWFNFRMYKLFVLLFNKSNVKYENHDNKYPCSSVMYKSMLGSRCHKCDGYVSPLGTHPQHPCPCLYVSMGVLVAVTAAPPPPPPAHSSLLHCPIKWIVQSSNHILLASHIPSKHTICRESMNTGWCNKRHAFVLFNKYTTEDSLQHQTTVINKLYTVKVLYNWLSLHHHVGVYTLPFYPAYLTYR